MAACYPCVTRYIAVDIGHGSSALSFHDAAHGEEETYRREEQGCGPDQHDPNFKR